MGMYKKNELESKSGILLGVYEIRNLEVSAENFGSVWNLKKLKREAGIHADAVHNKIIRNYTCGLNKHF